MIFRATTGIRVPANSTPDSAEGPKNLFMQNLFMQLTHSKHDYIIDEHYSKTARFG